MCSSLFGLGGTYVQQCFVCLFPKYLLMCRIFLSIQKQFNMTLLSYMSYQNHVGLQPANLVTTYISVHSRDLSDVCRSVTPGHRVVGFHSALCISDSRCWDIHYSGDASLGFILGIRVWDSFPSGISDSGRVKTRACQAGGCVTVLGRCSI